MEGGKTLMFPSCFCFPADPCGWHHQEHAGVRDRAGGGHRPRITGYGLLSGSWTPLYHVWEAGKKPHQTTLLGNFLAWPCNGWQNLAWNSQSENSSYKRSLCCIKNLMIVLRNHCIYTLMEIIEGLGHRPWGEKTPPSVALCGPRPAGYVTRSCCRICCVPRCSPPPFKLWLHLPPTWVGWVNATLNHLAPNGVFGEAGASLRRGDLECGTLPAGVQANFIVTFLLCY